MRIQNGFFFRYVNPRLDWPDIQIMGSTYAENVDGGIFSKKSLGLTDEYFSRCYGPYLFKEAFTVTPLLLRPKSKGKILLKSKNPKDHPLIYPNYFEHEDDIKTLVNNKIYIFSFKCFYRFFFLFKFI